jgi:hypothetical protein
MHVLMVHVEEPLLSAQPVLHVHPLYLYCVLMLHALPTLPYVLKLYHHALPISQSNAQ